MLGTTESEARYRTVFDRHHPQVYAYFRRRIDEESAKDCTAETFLIAWRRRDVMPGDGEALRWLYRISRNVLRNAYRSKRRSIHVFGAMDHDLPDNTDSPETVVVRREEEREVIAALRHLSPDDQEVLLLSVWEELPMDDIAHIIGCSPHAASQRRLRASKRLARQLERVMNPAGTTGHGKEPT